MNFLDYFPAKSTITIKEAVLKLAEVDVIISHAHLLRTFNKYEKQKLVTTIELSPVNEKTFYIGYIKDHVVTRSKKKLKSVSQQKYKINIDRKYGLTEYEMMAINQVPSDKEFSTADYKGIHNTIDELSYRGIVVKMGVNKYQLPDLRLDSKGFHHIDGTLEKQTKTKHLYSFFKATSGQNYESNHFFNTNSDVSNSSTSTHT